MKKLSSLFLIIGISLVVNFFWQNLKFNQEQNKMKARWEKVLSPRQQRGLLRQQKRQKFLKVEKRGPEKNQIGLLAIPRLNIKQVVLEDAKPENLAVGPSLIEGTAFPGTKGKAVIAGHRVTYTHPFRDLQKLKKGDRIIFSNSSGSFTYKVYRRFRVTPDDTSVLKPTVKPRLFLLTCDPPYRATYRLIVAAKPA